MECKTRQFGSLVANIYDFSEVGDELPSHQHDDSNTHISIVSRGSFCVFGGTWEITAKTGDVLDWKPLQEHGFIALEAGSRLVNITK